MSIIANGDGDFAFRLLDLAAITPSLTVGDTVTVADLPAFQTDVYRFTGTAGQFVLFDGLDADGEVVNVIGLNPHLNQIFYSYNSQDQPTLLGLNGDYYLLVDNGQDSSVDYSFRLLDVATQPPLTVGDSQMGTLDPSEKVDLYRFAGSAGQRIYLQAESDRRCDSYWTLYRVADGAALTGNCAGYDFELPLPTDGTYAIAVSANTDVGTVPYQFTLINATTNVSPLPGFDTEVTGSIANPGDQRIYEFAGTVGQKVLYDGRDGSLDRIRVTLRAPDGQSLNYQLNSDSDSDIFTLPQTGTYQLLLDGDANAVGDYRFQLHLVANATQINLNEFVTGSLLEGRDAKLYRFNSPADTRLYFDALGNTDTGASWYLYGPTGSSLTGSNITYDFESLLTNAGEYTLVVFGQREGGELPFQFRIVSPVNSTTPLTLGETYGRSFAFTDPAVTLNAPASLVRGPDGNFYVSSGGGILRFNGTTGAFIDEFVPASASGISTVWGLTFGPTGDLFAADRDQNFVVRFNGATGQSLGRFVKAGVGGLQYPRGMVFGPDGNLYIANTKATGTGSQAILRFNGTTGAYMDDFVSGGAGGLQDPHSPVFGPDGKLYVSSYETDSVLRYDGSTGAFLDTFIPAGSGGLDGPVGKAFLPNGDLLVSSYLTNQVKRYDSTTGAYLGDYVPQGPTISPTDLLMGDDGSLFIVSSGTNRVVRLFGTEGGCSVDNAICGAGQRDEFTFTGQIGQRIYFDALNSVPESSRVKLIAPNGTDVSWNYYYGYTADYDSAAPLTLTQNGTYRVIFSAVGDQLADYHFRLLDAAAADVAAFDTDISATLSPHSTTLYRVHGTVGERVFVTLTSDSLTPNAGQIILFDPANVQVGNIYVDGSLEYEFSSTGEFLFVVSTDDSPLNYTFRIDTPETTAIALDAFGPVVAGPFTETGETHIYTFVGAIGQRIIPDAISGEEVSVTVFSPSGVIVWHWQGTFDENVMTLIEPGTYRVELHCDSTACVSTSPDEPSYSFRIADAAHAPVLPFNTIVNNSLVPGTRLDVYQIAGVANQEITFQIDNEYTCSVVLGFVGPGNQLLAENCLGGDFSVVLPADGTYLFTVSGFAVTPAFEYSIEARTSALLAANPASNERSSITVANDADVTRLLDEAIARFNAAGIDRQRLDAKLQSVQFVISDLPPSLLGLTAGNTILIDRDAAGRGWYIDANPADDDEFSQDDSPEGYDLLTAIMHELGHVLGADHSSAGLMSERLSSGVRATTWRADLDSLFDDEIDWLAE